MKYLFWFLAIFCVSGCQPENNSYTLPEEDKSDTLATQFNPAHAEETDSADNCHQVESEMGSGEECTLPGTTIQQEYRNLIQNKMIEGIEFLPDTLPEQTKAKEINKEGLLSADYKWDGKDKLQIVINYDGGVTEIKLIQTGKNLKRAVYYSAD